MDALTGIQRVQERHEQTILLLQGEMSDLVTTKTLLEREGLTSLTELYLRLFTRRAEMVKKHVAVYNGH